LNGDEERSSIFGDGGFDARLDYFAWLFGAPPGGYFDFFDAAFRTALLTVAFPVFIPAGFALDFFALSDFTAAFAAFSAFVTIWAAFLIIGFEISPAMSLAALPTEAAILLAAFSILFLAVFKTLFRDVLRVTFLFAIYGYSRTFGFLVLRRKGGCHREASRHVHAPDSRRQSGRDERSPWTRGNDGKEGRER